MRVFSVPVSAPFLRTVVAALVDGRLVDGFEARTDPARLAQVTLYLPTLRAGRMAREIFLDELKTDAVVLPRIVALGDIDEDELAFAQADEPGGIAPLDIPPKLGELRAPIGSGATCRRMGQAPGAVTAGRRRPGLHAGAGRRPCAADRRHGDARRRWSALDRLVPDQFDKYWQITLEFLEIARECWPAMLAETDRIEPAARRDLLIEAEAARLTRQSDGPVIAAGSTGSMPSTAKFLQAVASLPHGAVVLPGLDTDLDDDAWRSIGGVRDAKGAFTTPPASNHPQYAMHALLSRFGIKRGDVEILGKPAQGGREVLVSEAMRPSNATAQWHDRLKRPGYRRADRSRHGQSRGGRGAPTRRWRRSRSRWRCARRGIWTSQRRW